MAIGQSRAFGAHRENGRESINLIVRLVTSVTVLVRIADNKPDDIGPRRQFACHAIAGLINDYRLENGNKSPLDCPFGRGSVSANPLCTYK